MRKTSAMLVAISLMAFGAIVNASEKGGLAVGAKGGTLGAGVELNYPISSMFSINVGINKFTSSATDTTDGIEYDVDLNLQTVALLGNIHPFGGSFRITAGAMLNNNELKMTADPAASYDIGGTTYTAAEVGSLSAAVDFNRVAPYAGIGWGFSASSGLGFTLDIGFLMQGEPNVELTSRGGTLSGDAGFQAELAQEEANAENDIKGFTTYPVVAAGINYRF